MNVAAPIVAAAGLDFVRQVGREHLAALSLDEKRQLVESGYLEIGKAAADAGQPFSCRGSGCFGCCRGEIAVLNEEVARLLPRLGPEVFARARANREALSDPERLDKAVCPVLDPKTGRCSVYEERPMVCRAYHVVTPAEWCYPERVGPKEVASVVGPLAIVAGIAMVDCLRNGNADVLDRGLGLRILEEADRIEEAGCVTT